MPLPGRDASVSLPSAGRLRPSGTTRRLRFRQLAISRPVTTGLTPLKANRAFYDGGSIPWITSGDLSAGVVKSASHFVAERALSDTSLKVVEAGAILLAMYGEGKTRGTAALLDLDATTNQACAAIQLHQPDLRAWVKLILDSNYSAMRRMAAGGVQPNLNLSLVRSIEIPVPTARVRATVLERLRQLDEQGSMLRQSLEAGLRRTATLRHALLAAAFVRQPQAPKRGQLRDLDGASTGTRTRARFAKPSRFRSRAVCMSVSRLKNGSHSTPGAEEFAMTT